MSIKEFDSKLTGLLTRALRGGCTVREIVGAMEQHSFAVQHVVREEAERRRLREERRLNERKKK